MRLEVVVGVYAEMVLMLKIMLLLLLLKLSGGWGVLEHGLHLHFHNYH
jgi:hypothetical protein